MELIERYIYAVTEQLPEGMKDDVGKELRSNIEDMLPEDYSESDVKAVLEELGNPWKIAEDYQPKQRYLIGPAFYGKYLTVLKLVVGIVMVVMAAVMIAGWVFIPVTEDVSTISYGEMFTEFIAGIVEGGVQAALWVTLIFVAIERGWFRKNGNTQGVVEADTAWTIRDLPQIPVRAKKISRSGTIIAIIATMLLTAIVYFQPQLIGIFRKDSDGTVTLYSLLETEHLKVYLPFILILALIQIALLIWKYIVQYWNYRLWAVHTIASVLIGILLIVMIYDGALIRDEIFNEAAQLFNVSTARVLEQWAIIVRVFTAAIIVITLWDSLDAWLKARRK